MVQGVNPRQIADLPERVIGGRHPPAPPYVDEHHVARIFMAGEPLWTTGRLREQGTNRSGHPLWESIELFEFWRAGVAQRSGSAFRRWMDP